MARKTAEERFWRQVEKGGAEDCWLWVGCVQRGYGRFGVQGKSHAAHRWFYERERGPVPDGKQLDHLCRNRACVNPAHLEPVTRKENILRGICPSAKNAKKTHCPKGHPLSGNNVKVKPTSQGRPGVYRACRACSREWMAAKRHRKGGIWQGGVPARARTHCPKGHPYDGIESGRRMCVTCRRKQKRKRYVHVKARRLLLS